jgi:hypothetical protein
MKVGHLLLLAGTGIALLVVIALVLAGCGGGGEAEGTQANAAASQEYEPSQKFLRILNGLKKAASSNETFNAIRRAKGLDEVERNVVTEFCNFTFQVRANHEVHAVHGHPGYGFERILRYAAYERSKPFTALVSAALDQLQTVIDLAPLDNEQLKRYLKACYR